MSLRSRVSPPLNWADEVTEGDGREDEDLQNHLVMVNRSLDFDDEKVLLVGALLGISSQNRTVQLKEVLQ